MIRRTFQLIRGVGPSRERELWAGGIRCWDDFPEAGGGVVALSRKLDAAARERIGEARAALAARDLEALARMVPPRERWRLYREFQEQAVFFDIETEGATGAPTVVSLFHARGFEVFLQSENLERLPDALARWPMWVSFNGASYDVPVLSAHFGGLPRPALHLDLCHACRRVGWRGGLKRIEDQLGFGRPLHLRGVDGLDAVLLWRAWLETKDPAALRLLVEYNLYDSIQLRTLAERVYNHGAERLGFVDAIHPLFERGDVLYDVTRFLMALAPQGSERDALERARRAAAG